MEYEFKEEKVKSLTELSTKLILDKGGEISFNWYMEQCGSYISWTCKGYIGNEPVKIKVVKY